jgi:HEAT repeat protein
MRLRCAVVLAVTMFAGVELGAQTTFEQTVQDLQSAESRVRLRAARLLNETPYPEAAVPLARVLTDSYADVQREAIAAELNIFRAAPIPRRSRLGAMIEGQTPTSSEMLFAEGALGIGAVEVPASVLAALLDAGITGNRRLATEALYAFGALASEPGGTRRRELLSSSSADLIALTMSKEATMRVAVIRVIGRVYEWRRGDEAIDSRVGDAVVAALNDKDRAVRVAAMDALGSMRYLRAVQALAGLFDYYGKGELAQSALGALARIGHSSSAPLFLAQLKNGNTAWKILAIEGLSRVGDGGNLPTIQAAIAADRNDAILLAGSFAAAALGGGSVESIAEGLRRPAVREQARGYLGELVGLARRVFSPYLQDPDPRMRADVLDALSLGRDTGALPLAMPLVRDPNPQVARAAERAVARMR